MVSAAGNSSNKISYEFYDNNPYVGLSYYRLKQYDFNGIFTYSSIRTINTASISSINVFPNPVEDYTNILINSPQAMEVNVAVYNSIGQQCINFKQQIIEGNNTIKVNTSELFIGMHTIKITTETNEQLNTKLFKK